MKNRRTEKTRGMSRILSLLLVLAMILTMMPAMAFAETGTDQSDSSEDKPIELVMFGNSTTNGFGLPDAYRANYGFSLFNNYLEEWALDDKVEERGFDPKKWGSEDAAWTKESAVLYNSTDLPDQGHMSVYAFPWMLKKHLAEKYGKNVDLTPFSLDGMRSDELVAFLDEDFYREGIQREAEYTDRWYEEHPDDERVEMDYGFLNWHMNEYITDLKRGGVIENANYEEAAAYVKKQIESADVIVVDICGNNFGTYLAYRIAGFTGVYPVYRPNTYETIEDVNCKLLPQEAKTMIKSVRKKLESKFSALKPSMATNVLNAYMYGLADCIVNFNSYMNMIHDLNPDATLISVGLNNPMEGLKFSMNGVTIDIGSITGIVLNSVNTYMKSIDPNSKYYYYADVSDGLESYESVIASANSIDELLADEEFGCGNYAINLMYDELIKEFMGEDGDLKTAYSTIQSALPGTAFPAWEELADDAPIEVTAGESRQYVVYDTTVAYSTDQEDKLLTDAVSLSPTSELSPADIAAGKVILTKNVITNIIEKDVKPLIMEMLHLALKDHQTIDLAEMQTAFEGLWGDEGSMRIVNYLSDVINGDSQAALTSVDWIVMVIYEKFLLGTCVGVHPDKRGCEKKSYAVIDAYEKGQTAREQTKDEIRAGLNELMNMMKYAASREHLDKIAAKLAELYDAMIAESCYDEFKDQFESAVAQLMTLIASNVEDMNNQAKEVLKTLSSKQIQKLSENLDFLEECLDAIPETTLKVAAQILKFRNQIKSIKGLLKNAGLSESKEILEELKDLEKQLMDAETKEDYEAVFDALLPIAENLVEIAPAAATLPEYKEALNELLRLNKAAHSNMDDSAVTSAKDLALLTAESIKSDFSAKVTFPGSKAKITLTFDKDELADGYVLKMNGKQVRYYQSYDKQTYVVSNAKVGTNYKFELTPYVLYCDNGKVVKATGKTVSKTVTPKVSVKKAAISSVKAGSKSLTVKWAKVTGASGYKISYKLGKKTKYVTVKGGSKKSKTVSNLTSGNYTVKVRAYKTVNGKKYYGKWSTAKKVKVK